MKADLTHYHDNRYYTEAETDARMAKAARYVGLYEQEITLAAGGEFYQAIPSTYQNGGYIYFINCSGNSLNFTANMEGYNMAVKNRGASTLATRVQVYFLALAYKSRRKGKVYEVENLKRHLRNCKCKP